MMGIARTNARRTRLAFGAFAVAAAALFALLLADGRSDASQPRLPKGFFGVVPQTILTPRDTEYMKAGGIETIRVPFHWNAIQPTPKGGYDWTSVDPTIELAARRGLEVLPFLAGTPPWLGRATTLPINNGRMRAAWTAFLEAAVNRYGPGGEFWRERSTEGVNYEPAITRPRPLRTWQIWNEANFFYFAYPASPYGYAQLLRISSRAIKSVRPGARIMLSGLFGEPNARAPKGMPAKTFLELLYRVPGIKNHFDAIALHPYAIDAAELERMVEEVYAVTRENRDRPGLYLTEIGWGSENNFDEVAFEQGPRGQVRQLRASFRYLIENRRRLNLKQVHWFSWKDAQYYCNFCDSVGLFREGPAFRPKPAWRTFVEVTGGRLRP